MRVRRGKKGLALTLFDLEATIMDVVWSKDLTHFTVNDVLSVLVQQRDIAYTTVMTSLARLHTKGLLRRLERELHCDRGAVANGADPAAIAHAIVTAARRSERCVAALGDTEGQALKLRVELLLAYQERPPLRSQPHSAFGATVVAAIAWALLPHGGRTWALDAIHVVAETTVLAIAS